MSKIDVEAAVLAGQIKKQAESMAKAETQRFEKAKAAADEQDKKVKVLIEKVNDLKVSIDELSEVKAQFKDDVIELEKKVQSLSIDIRKKQATIDEQDKVSLNRVAEVNKKIDAAEKVTQQKVKEADLLVKEAKSKLSAVNDMVKEAEKGKTEVALLKADTDKQDESIKKTLSKIGQGLKDIEVEQKKVLKDKDDAEAALKEAKAIQAQNEQKMAFIAAKEKGLMEAEGTIAEKELILNVREQEINKLEMKVHYLIEANKLKV